ncbi:DUF3304 domain-containing protein [Pseudomonas sp. S 311-6]|uniref:DUF3304 domain-containing protein n=2 Tax=Pseudomonas TaxID=286 RepID=UPI00209798D7|nr:DUF3304 domain-containing protein [Pseudomonas putida]MCO7518061.1 DUF3304 domain-containing protein [Pseudomonas putida]MCO7643768.1 DUF3304 domain-containing protein [Pseudomonas sp. S 311-6]
MNEWIRKCRVVQWLCGVLGLILVGCSAAKDKMAAGNLTSVNHVDGTAINWMEVNGYRTVGGGGRTCCIVLPVKWRPGLRATIKWEVDPDTSVKLPSVTSPEFQVEYAKHAANYKRYSTTVEIPEWQGNESCDLTVHFLPCQQVKVTTACSGVGDPNYPIKEPLHMKEPAVCTK